jgi:hypothetical protein
MGDIAGKLVESILSGGTVAVVALLLLAIVALIYDRISLQKQLSTERKDSRELLMRVVQNYEESMKDSVESSNSIKLILAEIKGRL